ncbi:MAG TPA: CsgG/HfaB family protein [Gemmatimonadales bacterium]|jgi:TolB-like protein|nr:CsgG/HfaB family protein [Gemmatimonadales bacterium]
MRLANRVRGAVVALGIAPGILLLSAGGTPAAAQDSRPGIAVLPFENGGSYGKDREEFEALRKGIAALLISELAQNPQARLVDRAETQRLLDEQGLAVAERVDKETAAKIGKLVGARYMVTGSFIDLYGDFRIDGRLINVETGEIMKVVRNDPKLHDRRDLFRMIQSVAEGLMAGAKLAPLPAGGGAAAARAPAGGRQVPTEALAFFSRALLYQDRGDKAKAVEYYEKALAVFPDFTEASEGLRKARGS